MKLSIFSKLLLACVLLTLLIVGLGPSSVLAGPPTPPHLKQGRVKQADRLLAAKNAKAKGLQVGTAAAGTLAPTQGGVPDYFGPFPNWAYSPVPTVDPVTGAVSGGIVKFDPSNNLNSQPGLFGLTIATGTNCTFSGQAAKCYEIHLQQGQVQILPPPWPKTTIRGYIEYLNGAPVGTLSYLGPSIVAQRDVPVRIKFVNDLPTGAGGNLFIPVDTTYMGAGTGPAAPAGAMGTDCQATPKPTWCYTENRATLHLHGGTTPWISDGTPHQWITPVGENTNYPQGVSVQNVPDMNVCGANNDGCQTFFYSNQQSARLMFYHDHAYGITRLNVYAGEAAGYVLTDAVEQTLINGGTLTYQDANGQTQAITVPAGTLPDLGIPLVIQDKTFVDASTMLATDPTWNNGTGALDANGKRAPVTGDLWYPHVYMPNQNPYDVSGANAMGRWDYGPWFWPPFTGLQFGPTPNPYCQPTPPASATATTWDCSATPWEPPFMPATPNPSGVPEAFMDTMVVNGKAYPTLNVPAGLVRMRILNAANDRFMNLSLWVADGSTVYPTGYTGPGNTEVKMVPFNSTQNSIAPFPTWWYDGSVPNPFDDRVGGVPDPATRGPAIIQIGTEGGFLPNPAVIRNQPVNYVMNKRDITVGNVREHALFLGPAERADILVDFTNFAGKTLILYNDSPAPVPAADPRLDYFTGDPDQTATGGAPSTLPGYGPNTRTVMQIIVGGSGGTAPVDDVNTAKLTQLQTILPAAFAASQDTIIVPQAPYNQVYNQVFPGDASAYVKIQDTTFSFDPIGPVSKITMDLEPKSIIEDFTMDYGRMNALLGNEIPKTNITNQTSIPQGYVDPPVEIVKIADAATTSIGSLEDGTQLWKITHNGVDTHVIHTHMFVMQLVNRVGWDGALKPPEANELGWKDTYRMNPLEDVIVAVRPIMLKGLPFKLPNSIRLLDVTRPQGATNTAGMMGFTQVGPDGNPVSIVNQMINFGWEYVYHCHILGHEENDMMRPVIVAVPPEAPTNLVAALSGGKVVLTWKDNSLNETQWIVQRMNGTGVWSTLATVNSTTQNVAGGTITYTDSTYKSSGTPYSYRVIATNRVGATKSSNFTTSSGGAYPVMNADSAASNIVGPPTGTTTLSVSQAAAAKSPVVLKWTYSAADQTGFTIQRATNSTFTSGLTTIKVAGNVTQYSDSPKAGTLYYYRVMPTNFLGNGSWSNVVSITPHP